METCLKMWNSPNAKKIYRKTHHLHQLRFASHRMTTYSRIPTHDLARRFGIEGQLEDGQRIGWKLLYVLVLYFIS